MLLGKREVYTGNSAAEADKIIEILVRHQIPYKLDVVSHASQWTGRGAIRSFTGSAGTNPDLDSQTVIYVGKSDLEAAVHFIQAEQGKA